MHLPQIVHLLCIAPILCVIIGRSYVDIIDNHDEDESEDDTSSSGSGSFDFTEEVCFILCKIIYRP